MVANSRLSSGANVRGIFDELIICYQLRRGYYTGLSVRYVGGNGCWIQRDSRVIWARDGRFESLYRDPAEWVGNVFVLRLSRVAPRSGGGRFYIVFHWIKIGIES